MALLNKNKPELVIGIDATNLRRGGGITHLIELISAAEPTKSAIGRVVIFGSSNLLSRLPEKSWLEKISPPELERGLLVRTLWQRFKLANAARMYRCDVLFAPGGNYSANFYPVVTMSRNMLPFEWQELRRYGFSFITVKLLLLRWAQSRTFQRVDGIIFLTEYAKKGVLKVVGELSADTITIPHGLNSRFLSEPRRQYSISSYSSKKPFRLLYVSIIDQYKHQWNVVEAVATLRQEGIPIVLDLVGPSFPPALTRLNASMERFDSGRRWVHYHGSIPFEKLHEYYLNADVGVFASSCENMPNILIETMASGLPIACSNAGPMPEVLGDAGAYFDPESPQDVARALRNLITSSKLRAKLATSSYQRALQFSWKRCAAQTFEFLVAIAKSSKHLKLNNFEK